MTRHLRWPVVWATLVGALAVLPPGPAIALNVVVSDCSSDDAFIALLDAVQDDGGGELTFDCGSARSRSP